MNENLMTFFSQFNSTPFLFIGSGLSRRYLGLEDWAGLLRQFCNQIQPYEYYCATAENDLPRVASLMVHDFHEVWWKSDQFKDQRNKYKGQIRTKSAALKYAISDYIYEKSKSGYLEGPYSEEISALKQVNVDGIITTNWDTFLEQLFKEYKVFVGQEQLLLANPQNIGEIYKIHGCISDPLSLVLTHEDYTYFNDRNSYLAAKLITIFIEHPIVFLGYSLSDPNIIKLLKSITHCLGRSRQDQIKNNLIFVQRAKEGSNESISNTIMAIDDMQLPISLISCHSFTPIFNAVSKLKKKIPAHVLRHCKDQLYELVLSSEPEEKLAVVGLDRIEQHRDIEFVVGIGVIDQHMSTIGYSSITTENIFEDLILDNQNFNYSSIINNTLPLLAKRPNIHLPVFKFLHKAGITSLADYRARMLNLDHLVDRKLTDYQTEYFFEQYKRSALDLDTIEIINKFGNSYQTLVFLPFLKTENLDVDHIERFLKDNFSHFMTTSTTYKSYYKKLACFYDLLKYGLLTPSVIT